MAYNSVTTVLKEESPLYMCFAIFVQRNLRAEESPDVTNSA